MAFNYITAAEAAEMIHDGMTLGLSGFTAPGTPKAISVELAKKAEREHEAGRPFKVNIFTGASTSDNVDGVLSRANAINMRATCVNASTPTTATTTTATSRKWRRKCATASTATSTSP